MSGLEALGLICNIAQLSEYGLKFVVSARRIYKRGCVDPALESQATAIRDAAETIKTSIGNQPAPHDRDDHDLRSLASECHAVAQELLGEMAALGGCQPLQKRQRGRRQQIWARLKMALRAAWRQGKMQKMEARLQRVQQEMRLGLCQRICKRIDTQTQNLGPELERFVRQSREGDTNLSLLATVRFDELRADIKAVEQRVEDAADRTIAAQQSAQDRAVLDGRRQALLSSLRFPELDARRKDLEDRPNHPDTFQWVFRNLEGQRWASFVDWLRGSANVDAGVAMAGMYWIQGKPGSGKSTLVQYVASQPQTRAALEAWSGPVPVHIICHYFWRPGAANIKNIKGFLCSFLYQLLCAPGRESLVDHIRDKIAGHDLKRSDLDWSERELEAACQAAVEVLGQTACLCLFVDGVDEIERASPGDHHPRGPVVRFLDLIERLGSWSPGRLKVCLASRPEHDIQERLSTCHSLRLQDLTEKDMEAYAESHLDISSTRLGGGDGSEHDKIRANIVKTLVCKAEGVFLWLCLAVQDLNRGASNHDSIDVLWDRTRKLPLGLKQLYIDILSRRNPDDSPHYRTETKRYISAVLAATAFGAEDYAPSVLEMTLFSASEKRPAILGDGGSVIDEPALARELAETEARVNIHTAGLLETHQPTTFPVSQPGDRRKPDRSFRFIHRTVYDFFLEGDDSEAIVPWRGSPEHRLASKVGLVDAWLAAAEVEHQLTRRRSGLANYDSSDAEKYLAAPVLPILFATKRHIYEPARSEAHRLFSRMEALLMNGGLLLTSVRLDQKSTLRSEPFHCFYNYTAQLRLEAWTLKALICKMPHPASSVLSPRNKSRILWGACRGLELRYTNPSAESNLRLIRWLLQEGADPDVVLHGRYDGNNAFHLFLRATFAGWLRFNPSTDELSAWLSVLAGFIDRQCNMGMEMALDIMTPCQDPALPVGLPQRRIADLIGVSGLALFHEGYDYHMALWVAPPRTVVRVLLEILRRRYVSVMSADESLTKSIDECYAFVGGPDGGGTSGSIAHIELKSRESHGRERSIIGIEWADSQRLASLMGDLLIGGEEEELESLAAWDGACQEVFEKNLALNSRQPYRWEHWEPARDDISEPDSSD